jgi:hypothetical protein
MSTQSHIDKVELKANLLSYPSHVGAPKIDVPDLSSFKRNGTDKVNKIYDTKYKELMQDAENLYKSFIINQEVYESSYRFEPIIGQIYHLYEDVKGMKFLSLIEPNTWRQKHVYSVILNSDMIWIKIE